jgi:glycerol-3-phosphate dehydrogenase (NAD(P)+)
MTRVTVMGCGSWGTTFAIVLADAGAKVTMWGRREAVCEGISTRHRNSAYLGDLRLPESISAGTDPRIALDGADLVVLAVPWQTLRAALLQWRAAIPGGAVLVSLMKGVELGTHLRMSGVITEVAGVGPLAELGARPLGRPRKPESA